jgi:hypothetical protein
MDRKLIDNDVADFFRGLGAANPDNPNANYGRAAEWIFSTVGRGLMERNDIAYFLQASLKAYGAHVAEAALAAGKHEERTTNPSIKAFGACVAMAVAARGSADRALACEVFDKLVTKGDNPNFAFYQAIDAIGGASKP